MARGPRAVVGLILTGFGVIVPVAFILWHAHVRWVVVDKSVSLVPGKVEVEFNTNFEGHYVSGIKVRRNLKFGTLQCLLGEKDYIPQSQCKDLPAVLKFNWELSKNGHIVLQGTSDQKLSG